MKLKGVHRGAIDFDSYQRTEPDVHSYVNVS